MDRFYENLDDIKALWDEVVGDHPKAEMLLVGVTLAVYATIVQGMLGEMDEMFRAFEARGAE